MEEDMDEKNGARRVVERMIEEVWNHKRLDLLSELYQPDAKVYLSSGVLEGSDRLRDEFIRPTQLAFPDLHHEIADIMVEGNKVAMRYIGSGTHRGDFDGRKATGKTINYEGINLFRMKDNRVSEVWNHSNWVEKFAEL